MKVAAIALDVLVEVLCNDEFCKLWIDIRTKKRSIGVEEKF